MINRRYNDFYLQDISFIFKYRHLLKTLEEEIEPRGVSPSFVYKTGVHAFRVIDKIYLNQCMEPEELQLLKGNVNTLSGALNKVYFGKAFKIAFVINPEQQDQLARMLVRLFLIDDLQIKLLDPIKYDMFTRRVILKLLKYPVLDLRSLPIKTVRKLFRWKKEYSPGFDGLIAHDRVDQLIDKTPKIVESSKFSSSSRSYYQYRQTDLLKWNLIFNKDMRESFTLAQNEVINEFQDEFRKWSLFCRDIALDNMIYTLRFSGKLSKSLVKELEIVGYKHNWYPKQKHSYLTPPTNAGNRKFACITQKLDQDLMLKIFKSFQKF